jgi:hypothetical protein
MLGGLSAGRIYDREAGHVRIQRKNNREDAMSKGNDKKAKANKSKPKAAESPYKQAQGKTAATSIPFAKRIGAK